MMPELKWMFSPDVEIETFAPEEGAPWGFLLQIGLAPPGIDGADSFDVIVCSPDWIPLHYGSDAIVDGRFHLIMATYSEAILKSYIERTARNSAAPTWNEVVDRFGQVAQFSS